MLVFDSRNNDPTYNLAAEEYLLKETRREYVFFYVDKPSVIIGKHQNAFAEVNLEYLRQYEIPIIRRITGGGTVWHDEGNVNFSFILNGREGQLVNFREYTQPVVDFLNGLDLEAEFGTRNEILLGGRKVSGNAEHVHRKRVLHHGTLLFDSDLNTLAQALGNHPGKYNDRAVRSISSEVGNIRRFLSREIRMEEFRSLLVDHFLGVHEGSALFTPAREEEHRIRKLAREKYSSWSWNLGYSPPYRLSRMFQLEEYKVFLDLHVEKGIIREIRLDCEGLERHKLHEFSARMKGKPHDPDIALTLCRQLDLVKPGQIDKFVYQLF